MTPAKVLWCLLIVLLTACAPGLYQYHSVEPEETHDSYRVIPLYVSVGFTQSQRLAIASAVNEMNYSLNGGLRLEIKDWNFDEKSETGHQTVIAVKKTHQGIILLSWLEDDERLSEMKKDGIVAFVDNIGAANFLVVLIDRLGNWNFKTIILHELGHALGSQHTNAKSLMYPYVGYMQVNCVDRITAAQIAHYQNIALKTMYYCVTEDFE